MCQLIQTDANNPDFHYLITFLDENLAINDGDEHDFYKQFNGLNDIKHVVIAYVNKQPVGCGSFKIVNQQVVEIKRVYVSPQARNKGIAKKIMSSLESWAKSLSFEKCILETGINQKEAVKLYPSIGYKQIDNYPPYVGKKISICFAKDIK